jgi:hypothetical protein
VTTTSHTWVRRPRCTGVATPTSRSNGRRSGYRSS